MKRFFYGVMAAGLLLASGCSKDKSTADDADTMSSEELAQVEAEAVRELAQIIAQEAADIPVADAEFDFPEDIDFASLTQEEQDQLTLWENEAQAWAEEEMHYAMAEAADAGLSEIQFAPGSAELDDASREALNKNVDVARSLIQEGRELIVQGHVDGTENAEADLSLSEARANAVREAFIEAGLPGESIEAVAYAAALSKEVGASPANERVSLALA